MGREKIGLLTIHDTLNYGSLLQTYATYMAIKSINDSVEIIDYKCEAIVQRERTCRLTESNNFKDCVKSILFHPMLERKHNEFWNFINTYMKISDSYDKRTIKKSNGDYDTFVVGSDIVWGTNITGRDFSYFLDFATDDKKKIAFSSSVGTKWDKQDRQGIAKLLQRFDHISVREQLASEWIKEIADIDAAVTCDPTMLYGSDFWANLSDKTYAPKKKYVLIYFTTGDKKTVYDGIRYARDHNLPAYNIDFFYKPKKGLKAVKPVTVQQWLSLFINADTIFTASYHGLLFSLYFKKPVFYYNRGETSRMISLSKELSIEHREGIDKNITRNSPIDYDAVHKKFEEKRIYSWNYLKNLLL